MTDGQRILILEDDAIIAMDLEGELSDRGFDPVCASSVPAARNLVEQRRPSFAILDMHIRTDTSFDLARDLAARGVPFVFVSGNDASSLPEDLRSSRILTKPINFDDLIRMLSGTVTGG